jgi:hypothetical protein
MRFVNSRQVLALQIDVTYSGAPFRFYGYCYAGSSGEIQLWTYTTQSSFIKNVELFTDLLNGLQIMDQPLPPSTPSNAFSDKGVLVLNDAKVNLKYDTKKWKQKQSDEPGKFSFTHSSGDGYAMVIAERITVPTDSLPDIAFSNAHSADPNAKIIFKETRLVNGSEVWFLKMDAEYNKIPFVYYGYYYSGNGGTVQVITYTAKSLLAEYDRDFMEFLNGLAVLN